jgi:hypothetical protein
MLEDGSIIGRPGDDDPGAIALMRKLSAKSRKRWPIFAATEPGWCRRDAGGGRARRSAPRLVEG